MYELKTPDYPAVIARTLNLKVQQVRAAVRLMDEGNTIPFIARYRKEMTGELDEVQLRDISATYESEQNLFTRKSDVLRLLQEQGVLADEATAQTLVPKITAATSLTAVDDLYRPYRPKRQTRASVARDRGLEPLANWLEQADPRTTADAVAKEALQYVAQDSEVPSIDAAVAGALDILAERIADDADNRQYIRDTTTKRGQMQSTAVHPAAETVYEMYYDYAEPLVKLPPHRVLAMNRGEREEVLRVSVTAPEEEILASLYRRHVDRRAGAGHAVAGRSGADCAAYSEGSVGALRQAVCADAYKRLIAPSVAREVRAVLTEQAEAHAIQIFGTNLRHLLLQPPLRGKRVLGVDPAYRTGCKLAAVDDTGKLLEVGVIYPTPPQNRVDEAAARVLELFRTYTIELVAIGNGTASRETEAFIADCVRRYREVSGETVPYVMVSEAGASVYSASPLAGEEFPDLDVSERSAISIARRLQDPLAELVRIDPKSIGVGQYQHDVSQKELGQQLGTVVESVVNRVGVDVNTASPSLLAYVSGLNRTAAKNIVQYRDENGRFRDRRALSRVPRIGPKTLEQCVGFLRVVDGNNVLDATPIHPESYDVVAKLLQRTGETQAVLVDTAARSEWLRRLRAESAEKLAADVGVGVPTLRDILEALERPGRDPRDDVPAPILRTDVLKLEDLSVGMELTGTVRNVVDFGAFVDIGVKNDGLVHISQLSDRFVKHPTDVVAVGDIVKVRVTQVDVARGRLGLSMKSV
ncbi:Tex family protein [Alicyclobacillus sp. ALC3]|uniref:Tex family protein n=1 Tax=Alicyclobacillus sp. ALC3 TaxID=2796143 RepID=UPI003FCED6E5